MVKIRLPDSVSSPQDVAALNLEISEYARWFYHNGVKDRAGAKHVSLPPTLSPSALELVREATGGKLLSQTTLDELIEKLDKYKTDTPTITITLAAPATSDIKASLVSWCRKNLAADMLVTFKFNSLLLGGMVIRYGSHIFDWSFRRQILEARHKFPEVLRRV